MSLEKKLEYFSSLVKTYKKRPLFPAFFKIIEGTQIELSDPTTNKKLTINNLSFTQKKRGFAKIKQKWIIKNTTEHGNVLMCIGLNGDNGSIVYYYSFEIENANQILNELEEIIGPTFKDLRININNETQIDKDNAVSPEEVNLFNELEKKQDAIDPSESTGGKRKTKKINNKKKKTKKRKRTRRIRS